MKPMCLRMLLLLLASAPVFSQQNPAQESRLIVEAVECKGNTTISCDFIRSKLHLPANSEVDGDAVQSAQLRLSALPNFESVRVYLEKGSEKGKARLIVEVVEASPIVTELALGFQHFSVEPASGELGHPDWTTENFTARIGHQNLFGRQKIGELALSGRYGSDEYADVSNLYVSLVYIDPSLFGVDRMFMSVSASYRYGKGHAEQQYDYYDPITAATIHREVRSDFTNRGEQVGLSLGYRLWDYSYVFLGFDHYADSSHQAYESSPPYEKFVGEGDYHVGSWRVGYGWDSEDDAYFPTRGSRLSAVARYSPLSAEAEYNGFHEINWRVAYKHTWMMGRGSVWTVNVGGEPEAANDRLRSDENTLGSGLGLTYARLLPVSDLFGGIRRGRWYVQLGAYPFDLSRDGQIGGGLNGASLALGLRFESKALGIVTLSATGHRTLARGGQ